MTGECRPSRSFVVNPAAPGSVTEPLPPNRIGCCREAAVPGGEEDEDEAAEVKALEAEAEDEEGDETVVA